MWSAIVILVLAIIVISKVSNFFNPKEPADIDREKVGLSVNDMDCLNNFRRLIRSTNNLYGDSLFSSFYNPLQNILLVEYSEKAREIVECLEKVDDKAKFAQVYRKQYGETVAASIIDSLGENFYLQVSSAVSNFGLFL